MMGPAERLELIIECVRASCCYRDEYLSVDEFNAVVQRVFHSLKHSDVSEEAFRKYVEHFTGDPEF